MSSFDQLLELAPEQMSPAGRIDALRELERLKAWAEAQQMTILAAVEADPAPQASAPIRAAVLDKHYIREEVALALRISFGVARDRLLTAAALSARFPAMLALLADGHTSALHCRLLVEAALPLPDPTATRLEQQVLQAAAEQTIGEFRRTVTRTAATLDPAAAAAAHRDAVTGRRVAISPAPHGMAELWARLPSTDTAAIHTRLHHRAHQLTALGDGRTLDQCRADALIDLITSTPHPTNHHDDRDHDDETGSASQHSGTGTGTGAGNAPSGPERARRCADVQLVVSLDTLRGLSEAPGELCGYGPIPAEAARELALAPGSTLRRLLVDSTGTVLDYGRTTYRPPAALAELVTAKHHTCRLPGCTRSAAHCDLDHTRAWHHGGTTSEPNLWPLCPRHHHLKHEAGWTVHRTGDTATWTTPTGHHYHKPPHTWAWLLPPPPEPEPPASPDHDPPPF